MSTFPTFSSTTTAEEVAKAFADVVRGKNVLITGTSLNGVGYEAARVIAEFANLVVITGYNEERLKRSEDELKTAVPSANIRPLILDLSSQAAVRQAAAEVNAYSEPLHVLIHNAGANIEPAERVPDLNVDRQWATNHFGPFLFNKLILPKLLSGARPGYIPRVVYVAAQSHQFGPGVDLENLGQPTVDGYSALGVYWSTKSANIMISGELTRRAQGKVNAYSLHPGVIFTNIFARMKEAKSFPPELSSMGIISEEGDPDMDKFPWKTIAQGAATTVVAAFDPRLDDTPGAYLDDCRVASEQIAAHTADPEKAAQLWTLTEEMIGEKFEF
ncbi:hypothetical protein C8F01DRAFT_1059067 [Mycena amicta]|nr:hypothetical protein C8F01DRAFT_1059067 [Mycena amicta]